MSLKESSVIPGIDNQTTQGKNSLDDIMKSPIASNMQQQLQAFLKNRETTLPTEQKSTYKPPLEKTGLAPTIPVHDKKSGRTHHIERPSKPKKY